MGKERTAITEEGMMLLRVLCATEARTLQEAVRFMVNKYGGHRIAEAMHEIKTEEALVVAKELASKARETEEGWQAFRQAVLTPVQGLDPEGAEQ